MVHCNIVVDSFQFLPKIASYYIANIFFGRIIMMNGYIGGSSIKDPFNVLSTLKMIHGQILQEDAPVSTNRSLFMLIRGKITSVGVKCFI